MNANTTTADTMSQPKDLSMTDERQNLPSASAFPRLAKCPGSHLLAVRLREAGKIPQESTSKDAEAGRAGHRFLELWAKNPELFESDQWQDEWDEVWNSLDNATADTCSRAIAQATNLLESQGFGIKPAMHVEERFWLYLSGEAIGSAQVDACWFTREKRLLIDWKMLFGKYDSADRNWQLRMQVACLPTDVETEVIVSLIQPMAGKPTISKYSPEDISKAKGDCRILSLMAMEDRQHRFAGDWCKYCPCLPFCPEAGGAVTELAVPPKEGTDAKQIVASATSESLSALVEKASIAQKVIDAAKAELKRRIQAGEIIQASDGRVWQIGKGKTERPVTDPQQLWNNAVSAVPSLNTGDMMSVVSIAKGEFEKMLRSKAGLDNRKGSAAWKDMRDLVYTGCLGEKTSEGSLELVEKPVPEIQ